MVLSTAGCCCERRLDTFWMRQFQCTVHLIGRDMVKTLAFVFLWQRLPIELGGLEQRQCSHHIGLGKGEGILDTTVHMTLCCQMDDTVHLLVLHQLVERIEITNVHLHKLVVGLVLDILEISQIPRIRQLVKVDDVVIRVFVHKQAHHMTSNKACATGNYNRSLHILLFYNFTISLFTTQSDNF